MKKRLIGIVCALAMLSPAAGAESDISPIDENVAGFEVTVKYTGKAAFNKATLMLMDGDKLVYMSEGTPDPSNMQEVTFDTFRLPESLPTGDYTLKVKADGDIIPKTISFKNQIEREKKFLTLISSTTATDAATNMKSAAGVVDFGYNETFEKLPEGFQQQICRSLVELKLADKYEEDAAAGTNNAEDLIITFCEFMNKMYEAVAIMNSSSAKDVIKLIDDAKLLQFDSTYFSDDVTANPESKFVYDRESIADAIVKHNFLQRDDDGKLIYSNVNIDKLYELLNGNTLLHVINNNDYATAEAALKHFENDKYMKIDYTYYNKLNSEKKAKVFTALKSEKLADYTAIPGRFYDISEDEAGTGGGSGGNGGSGLKPQKPSGGYVSIGGGGGSTSSTPAEIPEEKPTETVAGFNDLGNVSWAHEAITELKELGAVNGVGNGKYEPNSPVTREAFVKIVVGAFGFLDENATSDFSDVDKDGWSYPYISSAFQNGLIKGTSAEFFNAKGYITRQDAAVVIYRAYSKKLDKVESDETFTDMDSVSGYAKEAVAAMKKLGIISGYSDGSFRPEKNITRAECAKMVYEAYKLIQQ